MKTNFRFKRNGWELSMILNVPFQEISPNNTIEVDFEIIGLYTGMGVIELDRDYLVSNKEIEIKPYAEDDKILYGRCIKIPKEIVKQIKIYLE